MESAESHLAAAEQALREGHTRTALDHCRAALQIQPLSGQADGLAGLAYVLMGETDSARESLSKAAEKGPLDSKVRYYCYLALARLGDVAGARVQLSYFVDLEPKNAQAKQLLDKMGGPPADLEPLKKPRASLWYDGGGEALCDSGEIGDESDMAEPPPGPEVMRCPECNKRTWKGIVCKHCGVLLPREPARA